MGQYFRIVNLDKRQCLDPHKFDDGLKLREFGFSGGGTMAGLAVLLSNGGGHFSGPEVGSWRGDRIVIAGDYDGAPPESWGLAGLEGENLYEMTYGMEDISDAVADIVRPNLD